MAGRAIACGHRAVHMLVGADDLLVTLQAQIAHRLKLQEFPVRPAVWIVASGAIAGLQRLVDDKLFVKRHLMTETAQSRALAGKFVRMLLGAKQRMTSITSAHTHRTVQSIVSRDVLMTAGLGTRRSINQASWARANVRSRRLRQNQFLQRPYFRSRGEGSRHQEHPAG
jgi:hypothetical protein